MSILHEQELTFLSNETHIQMKTFQNTKSGTPSSEQIVFRNCVFFVKHNMFYYQKH